MDAGEKIREARERLGLSQNDLARRIGITQPAIKKIEAGDTRQSKFLPRIARELGLALEEIVPGLKEETTARQSLLSEAKVLAPSRDFPIHAAAEGGDGEIIISTDPVDWQPRPEPLTHVRGAYGLYVVGTSMIPEYRPGDIAIVNPNLPILGDEVYIFYSERHGEARATIKHLRRESKDRWYVSQWNPPPGQERDFTLVRKEWSVAHRVIGKYSRL